jgi:hypothetical protein
LVNVEMIEHLKMIQAVINRMAQTSFIIKGWSITVVAGILTYSIVSNRSLGLFALFPSIMFWGLDSYYLWQERLFRSLYDAVRSHSTDIPEFSMNTKPYRSSTPNWFRTLFSRTELAFYGGMLAFILIVSLLKISN